jgi:phospholipid transport system transporter-binding protein
VAPFLIRQVAPGRLAASGDLGFATAARALPAGLALIDSGTRSVDLSGLEATDSAGLAVLVEWLAAAQGRGAALAYESVPAQLLAIARISELDGLLLGQSG